MSDKIKDIAIRAAKTFWQTALATLIFSMPELIENIGAGWEVLKPVIVSIGVGVLSAGFSAAYNGVLKPFADKLKANNTSVDDETL